MSKNRKQRNKAKREPFREITREDMERIARIIEEFLPREHVFIVFTIPTGNAEDRRVRYLSNGKRADCVAGIKEWLIQRGFEEYWMRHKD